MKVTAKQFNSEFRELVRQERGITRQVVEMIAFCMKRKFYAELGYSCVVNWLRKDHGYPKTCAYRRWEAAKLVISVPGTEDMIEDGRVNLSTLATLQQAIRLEEKRTDTKISSDRREELLLMIEDKTEEQANRIVAVEFPEIVKDKVESVKPVSATETRMTVIFADEQMAVLERVREVTGHSHFGASWSELMVVMAKEFLKHKDPAQKAERSIARAEKKLAKEAGESSAAELSQEVSPSLRATIIFRDDNRCTFVSPVTGERCDERRLLEVDHIIPRAFGGTNEPDNLRACCRSHNQWWAVRKLGVEKATEWRN